MPDWAIVAIIGVVVLFGASKLPEIARNLGRSSGEFKKGLKEGHDEKARPGDASAAAPGTTEPAPPTTQSAPPTTQPAPPADRASDGPRTETAP